MLGIQALQTPRIRAAIALGFFTAFPVARPALAGQSVQVLSGRFSATIPDTALWRNIGAPNSAMRWEMRTHNFTGNLPANLFFLGGGVSLGQVYSGSVVQGGGPTAYDLLDNNGPGVGCCSGHADVLIRLQRDVANQRYTLEVQDVTGSYSTSAVSAITGYGPASWVGSYLSIAPGADLAFLRWFSTAVPLGTAIPKTGVTGDLGDWEFDGNGNDSSGNGLNFTGGVTGFAPSPVYPPACRPGAQQTFRAGYPGRLDGSASTPNDGGATLNYLWRELSGPAPVQWSDPGRANPTIQGLTFGSYVFQLTVTDGSGGSSSCSVKDGAVFTDDNGVVVTNNAAADTLLGPMVRWGANPWPWFDDRHKAAADLQIANMDTYYGAYWNVPGPGTVAVTASNPIVVGSATAFTTTFCQGPVNPQTPKPGAQMIVWYPDPGGGTGRREWTVASCQGDTQLTLAYPAWKGDVAGGSGLNYTYDDGSISGVWQYGNGPANFYDNVAAF